jgi:hypothetical protein
MRNKELFDLLDTGVRKQIADPELTQHANNFILDDYRDLETHDIQTFFSKKILENPSNKISGYEKFIHHEFVIGVTQFIDNLVMKHGINGLQILKHDYTYYQRLNPDLKFAEINRLEPYKPLVMSMPFAGHCDVHKDMNKILKECQQKNIDVHLDCAWLTCAEGINFNFDHPCIKSFASSLSKAYNLGWNRIGVRWTKEVDPTDPITIYNKFHMYNESLCKIGYHMAKHFPINFLWEKYRNFYYQGCRETYTFPTKIIWLTKDPYGELYGTSKLLTHLYNVSMNDNHLFG